MAEGTIVLVGKDKKTLQVKFISSKGKETLASPKESELSQSLLQKKQTAIAQLDGLQVEFELFNGQPIQIREHGQVWEAPRATDAQKEWNNSGNRRTEKKTRKDSPEPRVVSVRSQPSARLPGDFHNPYNFVPALPRHTSDAKFGDAEPVGHGCYQPDRWSGRIAITLTTITPLLIPDAANLQENTDPNSKEHGHKTYPIRLGSDGKPYLPPTSIKGMLRAAYETVTNSRFSVFEKHSNRLAYRTPAEGKSNQFIYPARVELREEGLYLRILAAPDLLDKAGKLPRYRTKAQANELDKGESRLSLTYDGSHELPQHGDPVWVRLNLQQNDEVNLPSDILSNLRTGLKKQQDGSVKVPKSVVTRIRKRESNSTPPGSGDWRQGWVCVTGANISGKRYERVFIEDDDDSFIPINEELKTAWKDLILDYQKQHQRDLEKRQPRQPQDYLGDDPGKTGWSTHVYQTGMEVLKEGTLCYVELTQKLEDLPNRLTSNHVQAIAPVVLSRRLYTSSPEDLLDQSLKPATNRSDLSPADRVFGWVNQKGKGAYKGNLRIGPVQCVTDHPLESFGDAGLPLAILGQPKPQQSRFYIAKDQQGTPLDIGTARADGYQKPQGLRGRKVYIHHRNLPATHWDDPKHDRTQQSQNGFHQEYRRPQIVVPPDPNKPKRRNAQLQYREQRDDQNRSIQAWVKPEVQFQCAIEVTNLSPVELGALLWLLSLPDNHYHRLGAGKPLGFGSVRLAIDWSQTDLRTGQDWGTFYQSFDTPPADATKTEAEAKSSIAHYQTEFAKAYGAGKPFAEIPMIQAFCRCAQGFEDGKPIHYPRARQQPGTDSVPPHPEGKAFEWFVANERSGQNGGPKVSLPELWNDRGLPLLDKNQDKS
jgi:CRISPR-associated protein (TIGR03986 family)